MNWIEKQLARHTWGFLYVSGLSLFIPWLLNLSLPTALEELKVASTQMLLLSATVLTLIGVIGTYITTKRIDEMLKWLGLYTLIPGIIGLVFSFVNKQLLYSRAESIFPSIQTVTPAIDLYLQHTMPKIFILTIAFFVIGTLLYMKGRSLTNTGKKK